MPGPISRVPKYRKHKPSGQAIVRLNKQVLYLGPHGSPASRAEYDRLVGEWLTRGRRPSSSDHDHTINEMLLAYWRFAETYYVQNGEPTSEQNAIKIACRPLRRLYGSTPAKDFGPLALKTVRREMEGLGWVRKSINQQITRLRRAFKWAAANELVPESVHAALTTVEGLKKGRSPARESEPVRPVPEAYVEAIVPYLPRQVGAMVRLLFLTGMRPGEVAIMRTRDLDRSDEVWVYLPEHHKTLHLDKTRIIFLGPKAQAVLRSFLRLEPGAFLFDPRDVVNELNQTRTENRKTPHWPSHMRLNAARRKRQSRRKKKRPIREFYSTGTLRRAIERACEKAGVPRWTPNQLRHNRGTEIRKRYGLDGAKAVLGHSTTDPTEIYAELDLEKARKIMMEIG